MSGTTTHANLFKHTRRPDWGLAIATDRRAKKVEFLFQDGASRVFRSEFLHLLVPADKPRDVTEQVVSHLREHADGTLRVSRLSKADETPSLTDQMRLFRHIYPGGFEDPAYVAKFRGKEAGRRCKSMHGHSVADAQESLVEHELTELLESGRWAEYLQRVVKVMSATSLVQKKTVSLLAERGDETLVESLHALLFGDPSEAFTRFTRWVTQLEVLLDTSATWSIATCLPALLKPQEFVAVKRTPFQREAYWMAPSLLFKKVPNAAVYRRAQSMAQQLRKDLEAAGEVPRDLLDVTVFIRQVMRPKHLQMLGDLGDLH